MVECMNILNRYYNKFLRTSFSLLNHGYNFYYDMDYNKFPISMYNGIRYYS